MWIFICLKPALKFEKPIWGFLTNAVLETLSSVCKWTTSGFMNSLHTNVFVFHEWGKMFESVAGRNASDHEPHGFNLVSYCISVTLHIDAVSFSNQQKRWLLTSKPWIQFPSLYLELKSVLAWFEIGNIISRVKDFSLMSHELVTNGVNGTSSIHAAILEEGFVVQMQQMLSLGVRN